MRQSLLIGLLMTFFLVPSITQHSYVVDSLSRQLRVLGEDTLRVDAWNELAFQFRNEEPELAISYADSAQQLAIRLNYLKGEGDSFFRLGVIEKNRGNYKGAQGYYKKGILIREKLPDKLDVARGYYSLGVLYKNKESDFDTATTFFKEGLEIIQRIPFNKKVGRTKANLYNALANTLKRKAFYAEALIYFDSCITLQKELNNQRGLADAILNQATVFQMLRDYEEAEDSIKRSLKIFTSLKKIKNQAICFEVLGNNFFLQKDYLQALLNYEKGLVLSENYPEVMPIILRNIGSAYLELTKFDLALEYYQKSLQIFQKQTNIREIATLCFDIGIAYYRQGSPDSLEFYRNAISYCLKSLSYFDFVDDPKVKADLLFHLSSSYVRMQEYDKAMEYNNRYLSLKDSLHRLSTDGLNVRINLEQAKAENAQLNTQIALNQKEIAEKENRNLQIISVTVLVSLLFVLGLVILSLYLTRQKRRIAENNLLIAEQKEEIAHREIDRLLEAQEKENYLAFLEGQEKERERLARDLHDGLGSMLTTIKLYFSSIDEKITRLKEDTKSQYHKANDLLDQACEEVRSIAQNIVSGTLYHFGLKAALESMRNDVQDANNIKVELTTHGLKNRLKNNLEIGAYRIIQELVSNVLKHSKAKKMSIQVNRFKDKEVLNIVVEDNGIGFDLEQAKEKKSNGLMNLETRVHKLEGTIVIDSRIGSGTSTLIDIPLPKNEN